MGVISTRTPEGEPVDCPICDDQAVVELSTFPTSDAPCPRCGSLLWVPAAPSRPNIEAFRAIEQIMADLEAVHRRRAAKVR
jgi:uncharacterized paraquat-inducible protein A